MQQLQYWQGRDRRGSGRYKGISRGQKEWGEMQQQQATLHLNTSIGISEGKNYGYLQNNQHRFVF